MDTISARPVPVAVDLTDEELRFAELAARSGLEPDLARRLDTSPATVLAEFGVSPVPSAPVGKIVVIEDLSRPATDSLAIPTWCIASPEEPVAAAAGRC
ncbi:hypothetical protein [Streptomyces hygroscopicus]|uniref:hypothetical protein n=1 Tax=Streptomyces hygroscopicus TaxID=1912 RepID=UPI00223F8D2C|nr:hypothetical protein [Streptomyces hygroscopicus]